MTITQQETSNSQTSNSPIEPLVAGAIRRAWPMASPKTIGDLTRAASVVRSSSAPLIAEDEQPSRVGLVVTGTVVFTWSAPDGRTIFAGFYGPGQVMGLATLAGATATTGTDPLTPVTALIWDSQRFREIADADIALLGNLLDRVIFACHTLNHQIKLRTFTTARSRLAGLLIRYERLFFAKGRSLVPRSQLGALAGVTARMVSTIVRDWEAAGIVTRVGSTDLILLDRDALAAAAAPLADFPEPDPTSPGAWSEADLT
jgi:CRP-like cAMP-binding protein